MANKKAPERCTLDGCDKPHRARGFCDSHYARFRRNGDPGSRLIQTKGGLTGCVISECTRSHYARGMCKNHYTVCLTYSITPVQLQWIYETGCEICEDRTAVIHIDHDHGCCSVGSSCGSCIRGGLCGLCNMGIGAFRESELILSRAARYVSGRMV